MQAEASLSEKTAARRGDLERKGAPLWASRGPARGGSSCGGSLCGHREGWPIPSTQLWDDCRVHPEVPCELRESVGSFMWLQRTPTLPPRAPGPVIRLGPHGSRKLTPISWSLGLGL